MNTEKSMKTILRYAHNNIGFLTGLICALISLILFSLIESVRMTFLLDDSYSFGTTLSVIVPLILVYGGIFTFVPSGFGGYALEFIIRSQLKKGSLTESGATISGVLLAGVAVLLSCGIGLFVFMFLPHNGWQLFVDDIRNGLFFAILPYYIDELIKLVTRMLPEIITVTILACVSGGFAGKYLARRIYSSQVKAI